jgi:hypothetical protein
LRSSESPVFASSAVDDRCARRKQLLEPRVPTSFSVRELQQQPMSCPSSHRRVLLRAVLLAAPAAGAPAVRLPSTSQPQQQQHLQPLGIVLSWVATTSYYQPVLILVPLHTNIPMQCRPVAGRPPLPHGARSAPSLLPSAGTSLRTDRHIDAYIGSAPAAIESGSRLFPQLPSAVTAADSCRPF